MAEVTYLPEVECEVLEGIRESEVTVGVADESGNRQYLTVDGEFVNREGDRAYLPVGIVRVDRANRRVLIELPRESDSGFSRLWVPFSSFRLETQGDPVRS